VLAIVKRCEKRDIQEADHVSKKKGYLGVTEIHRSCWQAAEHYKNWTLHEFRVIAINAFEKLSRI